MGEEKTMGRIAYEAFEASLKARGGEARPWNGMPWQGDFEAAANAVLLEAGRRLRVRAELEDIARAEKLGFSGVNISTKTIGRREAAQGLVLMMSGNT